MVSERAGGGMQPEHAGLAACEAATSSLVALSPADRKAPGPRSLRESTDPDVAWIVTSNVAKNRLRRLLG